MGIAHGSSGRLWGLVFNGVVPEAVQDARDGSWNVHLDKHVRQQQQEAEASSGAAVSGSDVPTVVTLPCMLKAAVRKQKVKLGKGAPSRASSRTGTTRTGRLGPCRSSRCT
eukprot:TRINITY_DN1436_c0_g1_i5.p3 TRINITY_DN1436_c0_g1~~TRINITY_DN1436_c0_g1_i5.p3  ORF type:complete len:111 (-),score=20.29 TRINITY_DN1436_c0_g1_i5:686-1018(-)